MADRLKDKVALVTGGGTGIGKAIAIIFAREGAKVVVSGRTPNTLAETVKQIDDEGNDAIYVQGDVSIAADAERMVEDTIDKYGRLDVLVNNAGVRASILTVMELTEDEWQRTFDVDAKGTWLCSKAAIPEMRKVRGGSIIMISSNCAYVGLRKQGAYNAAKAAQELLMKCMALDFAPDKIRVNSICPAWVRTEMNRDQLAEMEANPDKEFPPGYKFSDVVDLHPIGRIGEPEDVAWAAVYFASDESSWATGSSLALDGGYTCQ